VITTMTSTEIAMVTHMRKLTNLSIRRTQHHPFPPATFPLGQRLAS
jgi:hypothetical protein